MATRRRFLGQTMVGSAFAALFLRQTAFGRMTHRRGDPVALPEGFQVRIISRAQQAMSDGYKTPGLPDGMAAFSGEQKGTTILMRNHEVNRFDYLNSPYRLGQQPPSQAYDREGMGGVTRLVYDHESQAVTSDNLVLAGTERNCAGGISPWGWLSCEETLSEGHGYVFLCDPTAERVQEAQKIANYGRFNHEAASVDPRTLIAYLTEDRRDGCFYRFVPAALDTPFVGRLQALAIVGRARASLSEGLSVGDRLPVTWVDIPDPESLNDDLREQAKAAGAAIVSRGEGLWLAEDSCFFSATDGGPARAGQIFRLDLRSEETWLTLVAQSPDSAILDMPDNLTIRRGCLYLAEDGGGEQWIRILRPDGSLVNFARNAISSSEFAGVCFSPDLTTMFVNIQRDGLTLAITGPFDSLEQG